MDLSTTRIWDAYADRLRRFLRKRVRSDDTVQDLLQDVFAKVHARLGDLRDPAGLEAWLFQLARRAAADHHRRRSLRPLPAEVPAPPPEPAESPAVPCVAPLLEQLPPHDREALKLADLEGRPQKELAGRLGLTWSAAKSRVQRARRRFREALLACCRIERDRRGNLLECAPRERRFSCVLSDPAPSFRVKGETEP